MPPAIRGFARAKRFRGTFPTRAAIAANDRQRRQRNRQQAQDELAAMEAWVQKYLVPGINDLLVGRGRSFDESRHGYNPVEVRRGRRSVFVTTKRARIGEILAEVYGSQYRVSTERHEIFKEVEGKNGPVEVFDRSWHVTSIRFR